MTSDIRIGAVVIVDSQLRVKALLQKAAEKVGVVE